MDSCVVLILLSSTLSLITAGKVKLVGGSCCSGRVEVLHGETWSTVCDADFDQQDAEVVCRELGCGLPVEVLGAAAFGRGEGQVWSDELQCRGNESEISFCPTTSSLNHNCTHDSDVGLVCAEVRLVGGSRCSGRVEVLHGETWSTVCDADFDQQDAEVVCRELGCGLPVEVLGAAAFGRGEGQVWSEELQCRGNESQIHFCPTSSSLKHNCSHDSDVGLVCSGHRKSRLTGGFHLCSGRVEVLNGETWSTVCDAGFDQQDAEVVCRELGCGLPVEVLGAAAFGRGEGQVWSEELQCRGNEFHISFCPTSSHNCSHDNDVGLVCAGHTGARLANGSDSCSGRVELQYLSEWGTVCDVNLDIRAASVLCGQLKCGSAVAVLGSDCFGEGSGRIWADVFDCQGNETHLSKCPISSWSRTACSHEQDAGVICSGSSLALNEGQVRLSGGMECEGEVEVYFMQNWRRVLLDSWKFKEIRLTEGCEGNLEVFYNGTWGNVCLNGMDEETVSLICQELNCGRSGSESWAKARVESAPNWLDNLKCRSHDSTLWQCPSSPWRQNNCDKDNEVAWITCSVDQTVKGANTLLQTLPPAVPSIYPVSLLLLVAVLFLALVLLVVLLYQNRVLRRGVSKRMENIVYEGLRRGLEGVYEGLSRGTERVYEEIYCRFNTARAAQRGSLLSEAQHSGYEDVDGELLPGSVLSEEQHSGYEDVDEELLSGEAEKDDIADNYDDVITARQISESVKEDVAEDYDDVITADQSSAAVTEDMTDNYDDDDVTAGPNSNIMTEMWRCRVQVSRRIRFDPSSSRAALQGADRSCQSSAPPVVDSQ
ncbi:hypothetical protein MHYP_G00319390 [Metynnis hypsauchen]